jgi:hypothetical protein
MLFWSPTAKEAFEQALIGTRVLIEGDEALGTKAYWRFRSAPSVLSHPWCATCTVVCHGYSSGSCFIPERSEAAGIFHRRASDRFGDYVAYCARGSDRNSGAVQVEKAVREGPTGWCGA